MATTAVKKTKTTETATESVTASVTEPVTSESAKTVEVKKEKKTYAPTDGIPCKSITNGGLYMPGLKSNILYTWIDAGDVIEIEYQDLQAAIRSNNSYVMNPFFVIEDEELVKEIRRQLKNNDGYCPCQVKKTPDTKCMCKAFREQESGECHCGLYVKMI